MLDDDLAAEFVTMGLNATMATMAGDPYLNHVPLLTGRFVLWYQASTRRRTWSMVPGCATVEHLSTLLLFSCRD